MCVYCLFTFRRIILFATGNRFQLCFQIVGFKQFKIVCLSLCILFPKRIVCEVWLECLFCFGYTSWETQACWPGCSQQNTHLCPTSPEINYLGCLLEMFLSLLDMQIYVGLRNFGTDGFVSRGFTWKATRAHFVSTWVLLWMLLINPWGCGFWFPNAKDYGSR